MYSATDRTVWSALLIALAVVTGCGTEGAAVAGECFVGDRDAAPELQLVYRDADGRLTAVGHMSEVPLIQPPQGGKVMFIGARARNIDGCSVLMSSALIDPDTGAVISLERRPIFLDVGEDGWLEPRQPAPSSDVSPTFTSNFSNLPACPRSNLTKAIAGEVYELRVSIEDGAGRRSETSVEVVPVCGEPGRMSLCSCECSLGYTLGGSCGAEDDAHADAP